MEKEKKRKETKGTPHHPKRPRIGKLVANTFVTLTQIVSRQYWVTMWLCMAEWTHPFKHHHNPSVTPLIYAVLYKGKMFLLMLMLIFFVCLFLGGNILLQYILLNLRIASCLTNTLCLILSIMYILFPSTHQHLGNYY